MMRVCIGMTRRIWGRSGTHTVAEARAETRHAILVVDMRVAHIVHRGRGFVTVARVVMLGRGIKNSSAAISVNV